MMRRMYSILCCGVAALLTTGCGTTTTAINVSNRDVGTVKGNPLGTYSDYGHGIRCDETDGLCRLDVYTVVWPHATVALCCTPDQIWTSTLPKTASRRTRLSRATIL
jgi:hypothetical protein